MSCTFNLNLRATLSEWNTFKIFFGYFGIWIEGQRVGGSEHLGAVDANSDLGVLGCHLHSLSRRHVTQQFANFLQVIDMLLEALAALVKSIAV